MLLAAPGEFRRSAAHFTNSQGRKMKTKLIITAALVALATLGAVAKTRVLTWQSQTLKITEVMTVEEFRSAGMSKLTPEEMKQLDGWLNRYTVRVGRVLLEKNKAPETPNRVPEPAVIESRIDGEFEGWDGDTVFKLENGQIWQQVSYDYEYEYAYRPKVLVYKSGSVYKMKVEGMHDEITVKRLK